MAHRTKLVVSIRHAAGCVVSDPAKISSDDQHLRSIEAVPGYHIHATDGEIGHVENFLIDDVDWSVRYFIVDTRNWWPGKSVLVSPRSAFKIDWLARLVDVSATRQTIKSSPAYDPSIQIDRAFEPHFDTYYRATSGMQERIGH
jgi:hypothetical protein